MSDHLFRQYILQPTRQNNILELFITGSASLVTHVTTSETKTIRSQSCRNVSLFQSLSTNQSSPLEFDSPTFRSLDFNKANFDDINNILPSVELDVLYDECDEE